MLLLEWRRGLGLEEVEGEIERLRVGEAGGSKGGCCCCCRVSKDSGDAWPAYAETERGKGGLARDATVLEEPISTSGLFRAGEVDRG